MTMVRVKQDAKSRWFKRGWTLQELIAPKSVLFFSKEGKCIGGKNELSSTIGRITRIPERALKGDQLSRFSKEERLAWVNGRNTTVPETAAYCLTGIFDVELHFLYAEGDYNKRKSTAMKKFHQAIAAAEVDVEPSKASEHVIRVGGASWSDLMKLGTEQLQRLDADLDEYRKWLLDGFVEQNNERILSLEDGVLLEMSQTAGKRMKTLLTRFGVWYEDLSGLEDSVKNWQEPWGRYLNKRVTDQGRVQAFVENRWYFRGVNEELYMGVTASRTLQDLMIWRGRWIGLFHGARVQGDGGFGFAFGL
jgi:hypothetical protein